ncbi:hypothetical protein V3C99_009069 [Haemonchus contortus]
MSFMKALLLIFCVIIPNATGAPLTVKPSFVLVDEDWPLSQTLPVVICPSGAQIIAGDPTHFFTVVKLNNTCSTLRLNKDFDADIDGPDGSPGESFSLVFQGQRRARATLEIQVVDVNDNPPQFVNPPAVISVSENASVGFAITKLHTRDADTGISAMARFTVDNDMFSIDKARCNGKECFTTLRLAKKLDFESQRIHHVMVTAEDGNPLSNRTLSTTHVIAIHVTDENDETPKFVNDLSQEIQLSNDQSIGDVILTLRAVDGDESMKNTTRIRYSIEENDYLAVDPDSGAVELKKLPLPGNVIRLKVTAKEEGEHGMETVEELRFRAQPTEAPKSQMTGDLCNGKVYLATIKEGESDFEEPLVIRLSKPTDPNSLHVEGGFSAFGVDTAASTNVDIRVIPVDVALIDYEKRKEFELYVTSPYGRCQINVEVIDVNDNAPKCDHDTFTFYVTENHKPTILGEVTATDADSAIDSSITYSIHGEGAELFAISEEGEFRSLVPIDREEHDMFELTVRATDSGGKWVDCIGKVVVRDINDNTPTFEHSEYLIEIDEEKTVKQKLEAHDPDIGENGEVVYTLENVPQGLAVDASAGILFIGKLDRDTMENDTVRLVLRATDRGQPPRTSATNVTIKVRDINDNWPSFTNSRYSLVLDANISPGGVIGAVRADDADATAPNNAIRYVSDDPRFRISDSGEVIYAGEGVLSKDTSAEFRVFAVDGGDPPHNSSAIVVINEHMSSMQSEHTAQIMHNETAQRREIVWPNVGMTGYTYEILSATADGFPDNEVKEWLEIDKNTGRIHTKKHPLPVKVKQIHLYISMRKGKREVPVELIINVVDTSDSAPFFNKKSFKAVVSEDSRIGSRLLQVKADADGESPLKYSLESTSGPIDLLEIDDEGFIMNKAKLDFESYRKLEGQVIATDRDGNRAFTNFAILLTDANDNRPVFVNGSVFTTQIDESAEIGTVLDLPYPLARDGDDGVFARLLYALVGNDGHFAINRSTSEISLVKKLDYEAQRSHSLTVRCVDNAGEEPFNEVFASVTVLVRDVNDNPPVIHNSDLSRLTVSADTPINTSITVLSVSDADEGGKQTVSLDANHTLFRITDKRQLVIAGQLEEYAGERLCSNIVATDSGSPPLSVSYPYCVTVYPASNNHNSPLIVFPKPESIHYFNENEQYDELLRVKVLEEESVNDVSYKFDQAFKKDWERFSLNSSGSLTSEAPFDFEKKPVYELKILACRHTNCSSVHIFISVNDRNDNCPVFSQKDVHLSVLENDRSSLPRKIGRVPAAVDADFHADHIKVCYTTDSLLFFFVNKTLSVLFTNQSFDREQNEEIRFNVIAYDCQLACHDPKKPVNGTIVVVVTIEDVNDNFPKFTEKSYHATVVQGQASPGSQLAKVHATDPDEEKQGLRYAISGAVRTPRQSYGASKSPISIDAKTGVLTAIEALRETSYSFTVIVTDGAGHEDSANVIISVVAYSQQSELLFDAPYDFIKRNQKNIERLLSNASSLTAVVDRCRQNSNFTVILAHFLDRSGEFVAVERAMRRLMSSNSTSRRELHNAYGLRDVDTVNISGPKALEVIIFGVMIAVVILLMLCICLYCRQRHSYARKLRHIAAQAAAHHASISRQPTQKINPYYTTVAASAAVRAAAHPPPPTQPPLQSTEL